MKMLTFLFLFLVVLPKNIAVESTATKVPTDMYRQSYAAYMQKQMGVTAAEIRAAEYRARYEYCDQDHRCGNETAAGKKEVPKEIAESDVEKWFTLWQNPMWLETVR